MTTIEIYSAVCAMMRDYAAKTGENTDFCEDLIRDPSIWGGGKSGFYGNATEILLHIREKMDKKSSGAGRVNVCKRMIKNAKKAEYAGIHPAGGKYCILDGFLAFRFSEDLPSFPRAVELFDFDKAIRDCVQDSETLPAVSRADIKAHIARTESTRAKPREPFTPPGWPEWYAVNPFYLLDILDAVPDAVFYKPQKYCNPLYFANGKGDDGILCPVAGEKVKAAWYEHVQRLSEQRSA